MKKFITIMVLALAAMLMVSCLGFSATEIEKVEFVEAPQSVYVGSTIPEITATIKITFVGDTEQTVKATINNNVITLEPTITGIDVKAVITDKAGVDNCHTLTINFGTYVTLTHEFYVVTDINEYYFAGGKGTSTEPYQITNAQQLSNIRYALDKNFILMNNIDISDMQWNPIGNGHRSNYAIAEAFKGIFDGNNKIINGLSNKNYAPDIAFIGFNSDNELDFAYGLFGCTDGATIKNLTMTNVNIDFTNNDEASGATVYSGAVGAVVGQAFNNLTLENVTVGTINKDSKIIARDAAAGLVGRLYFKNLDLNILEENTYCAIFDKCTNNIDITINCHDNKKIAGLVGFISNDTNEGNKVKFNECNNNGDFIVNNTNTKHSEFGLAAGFISTCNTTILVEFDTCNNNGKFTLTNARANNFVVSWGDFNKNGKQLSLINCNTAN